eukprot:g3635.t1
MAKHKKGTTTKEVKQGSSNLRYGISIAAFAALVSFVFQVTEPPRSPAAATAEPPTVIAPRLPKLPARNWTVPCSAQYSESEGGFVAGCHPGGAGGDGAPCRRAVLDDFVSAAEVEQLRAIAQRGMAPRDRERGTTSGPTIMDINTGYVRDPDGMANLFENAKDKSKKGIFARADFKLYQAVIERIRQAVMAQFELTELHFTAPTFITRLVGDAAWQPKSMHDEYYHWHVDKNNTAHYDYSGLLYLAGLEDDFQGGLFGFLDGEGAVPDAHGCYDHDLKGAGAPHGCPEYAAAGYCSKPVGEDKGGGTIADMCQKSCKTCTEVADPERIPGRAERVVEPARGRLVIFSSGRENVHRVARVDSGERLTMSIWFTCDKRRRFKNFLDGKMHLTFDGGD